MPPTPTLNNYLNTRHTWPDPANVDQPSIDARPNRIKPTRLVIAILIGLSSRALQAAEQPLRNDTVAQVNVRFKIQMNSGAPARFARITTARAVNFTRGDPVWLAQFDGCFDGALPIRGESQAYQIFDYWERQGSVVVIRRNQGDDLIDVQLRPLAKVTGSFSLAPLKLGWPVFGRLYLEGQDKVSLVWIADYDTGKFSFRMPKGLYRMKVDCEMAQTFEDIDLDLTCEAQRRDLGTIHLRPNAFAENFGHCAPPIMIDAIRRPSDAQAVRFAESPRWKLIVFTNLNDPVRRDTRLESALRFAERCAHHASQFEIVLIPWIAPCSFEAVDHALKLKYPRVGSRMLDCFSIGLDRHHRTSSAWADDGRLTREFLVDPSGALVDVGGDWANPTLERILLSEDDNMVCRAARATAQPTKSERRFPRWQ